MVGDSISYGKGTSKCTSLWSLNCPCGGGGQNNATGRRR